MRLVSRTDVEGDRPTISPSIPPSTLLGNPRATTSPRGVQCKGFPLLIQGFVRLCLEIVEVFKPRAAQEHGRFANNKCNRVHLSIIPIATNSKVKIVASSADTIVHQVP